MKEKLLPHEILVNEVLKLNYGDALSHQKITEIIDCRKGTNKYYGIIAKANKILLEKSKMIQNIQKVGYRVVDPNDYHQVATNHAQRAKKEILKGHKVLTYTPVDLLTNESKERHKTLLDSASRIVGYISGGVTELKLINRPRITVNNGR